MTETMSISYQATGDGHTWEITENGEQIAELIVCANRSEILHIWTREDHRGQGRARRLYETAAAQMTVLHAPVGHRTPEGDAFARAVGGDTAAYPCDCYACTWTHEEEF